MVNTIQIRVDPEFMRVLADINIEVLKKKSKPLSNAQLSRLLARALRDDVLQYEKIIRL